MSEKIRFTNNFEDLSTDTGFQFEFKCEKCGSGYRSSFDGSAIGKAAGLLDAASGIFGGVFDKASDVSDRVKSAKWEQQHDEAFTKAAKEIEPSFVQCPRCNNWVCRERCWNEDKGLCKGCAPDLGVEMAAAQASKSVEEVWAHAAMAEEDKKLGAENWRAGVVASCPKCEKPLEKNAKFCPECGAKIHSDNICSGCGAKMDEDAKFCPECGQKA